METDLLSSECTTLHRYLVGRPPDGYTVDVYRRAHATLDVLRPRGDWFDELLLRFARVHPSTMRIAQAYSRLFAPAARVRQKAVLMLAIVECNPATLDCVQPSGRQPWARVIGSTLLAAATFAGSVAIGIVALGPVHAAASLRARGRPATEPLRPVAGNGL